MASDSAPAEIEAAVIDVAASVFEVPSADLPLDATPDTVDSWDSLNHLKLITAVESRFDVRLPMAVVMEIDSVGALVRAVANCRS